jgi:hypothetical protein
MLTHHNRLVDVVRRKKKKGAVPRIIAFDSHLIRICLAIHRTFQIFKNALWN